MKLRKLTAFLLMLAMVMSLGINVFAENELTITTDRYLPRATINADYSATITASGGSGTYTFALENPTSVPQGLALSESGVLSGQPTTGGMTYLDVVVIVTDSEGNTARKTFALTVDAKNVTFRVGQNEFNYDNKPHQALNIVPYVDGEDASDIIDFTVTYDGEENQTNVGMYPIDIKITTPGYTIFRIDKKHLIINNNNNVNVSFIGNSFPYDGNQHSPQVLAVGRYTEESEWFDLEHEELYEGIDVEYSSSTPPTLPGSYRVSCSISDPNFSVPYESGSTTFEITRSELNFTLDNKDPFHRGDAWNRSYKPSVEGVPDSDYEVKYVMDGTEYAAPQAIGTYDVKITLKGDTANKYSVSKIDPATVTVGKELVTVTVSDTEKQYTSAGLEPTFNVSKEGVELAVSYTDAEGNPIDGKPVNAGTYNVIVEPKNADEYEIVMNSTPTFTITPITVRFTTDKASYEYDEITPPNPIITTNPSINADLYEVKYRKRDTEDEPATSLNGLGTYDVIIELKDNVNYLVSHDSTSVISVAQNMVDFTIKDMRHTFDGNVKGVTVEASINEDCYDIEYKQNGQVVASPVNAGEYTVTIVPREGYGAGSITPADAKLIIDPMPVTFTAENTTQKHDVNGVKATIKTTDNIPSSAYEIKYRKQGTTDEPTASASDVGVYDIILNITNSNYTTSFTGTLTVTDNIRMNYGNSPMGMIFKDPDHQNDSAWQQEAKTQLVLNNRFAEGYVPNQCSKDIEYPYLNGGAPYGDLEMMGTTLILKDIKDFTSADPGIIVNGQTIYASSSPVRESLLGDGVYTVTYTKDDGTAYIYEDDGGYQEPCKRYIMVVGKIGDVNDDNTVNATDANVLDHLTSDIPTTLAQARVWDVNKDGRIDGSDAAAIRNRFKTKLVPYYPWVK